LLLILSGAAGLVYQVLWIKQLSLVVGVEVQAVTTGVSAFFAGLALGGWLVGRHADRSTSAWRLYLWLEVAIALLGLARRWRWLMRRRRSHGCSCARGPWRGRFRCCWSACPRSQWAARCRRCSGR
jgi:MFS family permease